MGWKHHQKIWMCENWDNDQGTFWHGGSGRDTQWRRWNSSAIIQMGYRCCRFAAKQSERQNVWIIPWWMISHDMSTLTYRHDNWQSTAGPCAQQIAWWLVNYRGLVRTRDAKSLSFSFDTATKCNILKCVVWLSSPDDLEPFGIVVVQWCFKFHFPKRNEALGHATHLQKASAVQLA